LREILQQGAGSSGTPLRGPVATSKPAVEISAKDRDESVVRNLLNVKSGTLLLWISNTDTPLQRVVLLTYLQKEVYDIYSLEVDSVWRRRHCLDALHGN
jgi:hypothetical protein